MRKRKYYKKDRRGHIICMLITAFVFMLSVGYGALNEDLTISGEAHFRVEADIRITDVSLYTTTYSALEDYNSSFGKDSMKVGVTLPSNNSSVTYKVTVTNYGNVAMQLKSITKEIVNNNYNITFNKTLPLTIGKLSSEEIEITFSNATNTSQTINANLLFTFEKLEAMMTTGNFNNSNGTFYRGSIIKNSVESITFMSTKEVPEDAVGYWDCSYTVGAGDVIAYYLDEDEDELYELYISADGEVYAPNNSESLFMNFSNLATINFNNSFNTSKVTSTGGYKKGMFTNCSSLTRIDLSDFSTEKVRDMQEMFSGCLLLQSLDLTSFITANVTNMYKMFSQCYKLSSITFGTSFNTEKVEDMGYMFSDCKLLTTLNISNFSTDSVTDMSRMFYNCSSLASLDVSNFNVENVSSFDSMFYGCSLLPSLDTSKWKTSSATNMKTMFAGCAKITSLNLGKFNTSQVTTMHWMFRSCAKLTNLNLSSFDISSVTNMTEMFAHCSQLAELDIRNMDFENKTITTTGIFNSSKSGMNIYVLNEYNQTFIQGLKSNANVIIYVPPEPEIEEG